MAAETTKAGSHCDLVNAGGRPSEFELCTLLLHLSFHGFKCLQFALFLTIHDDHVDQEAEV